MKLKVWHIPQIPGKKYEVDVSTLREAKLVLDVLALYDLFQFENKIKPDYANAQGLVEFDPKDDTDGPEGSWSTWYGPEGEEVEDLDLEQCGMIDADYAAADYRAWIHEQNRRVNGTR